MLLVWDFQSVTRTLSALGSVSASWSVRSGRFYCILSSLLFSPPSLSTFSLPPPFLSLLPFLFPSIYLFPSLPPLQLLLMQTVCCPLPGVEPHPECCPNGPMWLWWFVNALPTTTQRKINFLKCTSLRHRLVMLKQSLPLPNGS